MKISNYKRYLKIIYTIIAKQHILLCFFQYKIKSTFQFLRTSSQCPIFNPPLWSNLANSAITKELKKSTIHLSRPSRKSLNPNSLSIWSRIPLLRSAMPSRPSQSRTRSLIISIWMRKDSTISSIPTLLNKFHSRMPEELFKVMMSNIPPTFCTSTPLMATATLFHTALISKEAMNWPELSSNKWFLVLSTFILKVLLIWTSSLKICFWVAISKSRSVISIAPTRARIWSSSARAPNITEPLNSKPNKLRMPTSAISTALASSCSLYFSGIFPSLKAVSSRDMTLLRWWERNLPSSGMSIKVFTMVWSLKISKVCFWPWLTLIPQRGPPLNRSRLALGIMATPLTKFKFKASFNSLSRRAMNENQIEKYLIFINKVFLHNLK